MRMGNLGEAERALREAVRLRPEVAANHVSLGALLLRTQKLTESRQEFEEAIRTGASVETARTEWFTALAGGKSRADAEASYQASLASQLAGAHSNLGTVLVAMDDTDGAIREFRLALRGDPKSAVTLVNLALTLAAQGTSAEARQRLEEALRIDSNLYVAHLKLGELQLAAGERATAQQHLRRAAESPDTSIRRAAMDLLAR